MDRTVIGGLVYLAFIVVSVSLLMMKILGPLATQPASARDVALVGLTIGVAVLVRLERIAELVERKAGD